MNKETLRLLNLLAQDGVEFEYSGSGSDCVIEYFRKSMVFYITSISDAFECTVLEVGEDIFDKTELEVVSPVIIDIKIDGEFIGRIFNPQLITTTQLEL